jgi:hypothetical protein
MGVGGEGIVECVRVMYMLDGLLGV